MDKLGIYSTCAVHVKSKSEGLRISIVVSRYTVIHCQISSYFPSFYCPRRTARRRLDSYHASFLDLACAIFPPSVFKVRDLLVKSQYTGRCVRQAAELIPFLVCTSSTFSQQEERNLSFRGRRIEK